SCRRSEAHDFGRAIKPMSPAYSIADCAEARQHPDGSWEGEVVWCPMITAQYVIARRILGRAVDAPTRQGIIRYFESVRAGAGWGLHPESQPYVFVTTLVYVALRLLGVRPEEPLVRG